MLATNIAIFRSWDITEAAQEALSQEPEVFAILKKARSLPSFKPRYRPTVVELLLDDLPYLRTVCGEIVYTRNVRDDYDPPFWELKFDGETALFVIKGEIIVNRVADLSDWLVGLGLLDSRLDVKRRINNGFIQ